MKLDEYASPSLNNWNVHSSRIVWNLLYLSFLFQFSTDWTLLFFQTQLQHWPNPNLGNSSTKEWVVAWTSLDIFYGSCRRFLGQGTKFESLSATCPPRLVCTAVPASTSLVKVEPWSSSIHWIIGRYVNCFWRFFQDYLIECCNFSDPTPSASSIVQVDHLYLDLRNCSTKGWVRW